MARVPNVEDVVEESLSEPCQKVRKGSLEGANNNLSSDILCGKPKHTDPKRASSGCTYDKRSLFDVWMWTIGMFGSSDRGCGFGTDKGGACGS